MNIREKLKLMKKIDADNKRHVEEFIKAHMKVWVADFAFIDADGVKHEWEPEDNSNPDYDRSNFTIQVEALNIREAVDAAEKKAEQIREECRWLEVKVTDIGICNDNIW